MNPIKLVRKLLKAFRGGSSFREIFLGVFLGFAIGMLPGASLTLMVLIAMLLLLNTNGAMAFVAFVIGKVLCYALAPITFHIGYFMIHTLGLSGLVAYCADTPVLALLNLDVYCMIAGIPIVIIVGGAGAWFIARTVVGIQKKFVAAKDSSEKLQALAGKKWMRFVLWLAAGKQKKSIAESMAEKRPLIRKGRLIAGCVLLAIIFVGMTFYMNALLRSGLEMGLAAANGAEVNVRSVNLSLLQGELVIEGLQVTDPVSPANNQVQAEMIRADISIRDLLTKRVVIDIIECDKLTLDAMRNKPGWVADETKVEEEEKGLGDFFKLPTASQLKEYAEKFKNLGEKIQKLREYLANRGKGDEDGLAEKLRKQLETKGHLRASAQEVLAKRPTWVINKLVISEAKFYKNLPGFSITGENLSSNPSLHGKMPSISLPTVKEALAKTFSKDGLAGVATGASNALKKGSGLLGGLLNKKK